MRLFTLFMLLCGLVPGLKAQVIINEFSAANVNTLADAYGQYEDWIELRNTGATSANISGYYLSDRLNNPTKWVFPAGTTIPAGGYLRVFASSRNMLFSGQLHTNFKITQTQGEYVVLANQAGDVIDSYHITSPNQTNHSWGRSPSTGEWRVYTTPTPGGANGANNFADYAPRPIYSSPAGFYAGTQTISLFAPAGSIIRYTLNGSEPTAASPVYSNPIQLPGTAVVRARIFSDNPALLPGFVETNTYFIDEVHTVPVISIAGTELASLLSGSYSAPVGSFELFRDGQFVDEALGEYNKHGNDSWAYGQRGIDYIARDQFGEKNEIEDQIFPLKDREGYQRLILKAAANDNYPFQPGSAHIRDAYVHTLSQLAELELDERTYEPCVIYANGLYWGVYEIREKVDDKDFTEYYYNQGEFDIDYIKTWGATWQEYGTWNEWYPLHTFITNNDMTDPANYAYVTERLEVLSLIDYMIINTHAVCKDWLNWNTAWWRGRNPEGEKLKWRYTLWDLDATFGHYINYTGVPNVDPDADPCDNEEYADWGDPEGHVDLIISLMENEEFHSLYVNRYADLLNSYLSCDYMIALLDTMIARIEPEMPQQIAKWGGNMATWQANVQTLRDFINARCTFIDSGIVDCYEVTGPYPVKVSIVPDDSPNQVKVNTFVPAAFPFTGDYFGGTTLSFQALPADEWVFHHWEVANQTFGPNQYAEAISMSFTQGDDIIAYFQPAIPCALPEISTVTTGQTTATIAWEGPFNFLSYEIRWRKVGEQNWTVISYIGSEITLSGLEPCTDYELQMGTICGTATSDLIDGTFSTECVNAAEERPARIIALQVYPNPSSDAFHLEFDLNEGGPVAVSVHTATGSMVWSQDAFELQAGRHHLKLEESDQWPSGMYFIRLQMGNEVAVRKAIKN
ncbi:MAG: CotH kinase family protein [Saprospirales bacterium]|nr:CotH kinase family protein [Saprospirales bacterium]